MLFPNVPIDGVLEFSKDWQSFVARSQVSGKLPEQPGGCWESEHGDTDEIRFALNSGTGIACNSSRFDGMATVVSQTIPASTAPSLMSLETSFTVGLKTPC
ncbi:MAG: hypothetical protein R3B91_02075 [Planctomycetaceae bacterium]